MSREATPLSHYLTNLIVALVWLGYAWGNLERFRTHQEPLQLFLLARNSALTLLFLLRRPATVASRSAKEWAVAIGTTFSGYLFGAGTPLVTGMTTPLMILALVLMTLSILALGRSFGIVPANRGIKTGGPYAVVRHPVYLCYVLFDIGYLLGAFSLRNIAVFAGVVTALYLRARYEERLLGKDPAYRVYTERTRYMFIPGLL